MGRAVAILNLTLRMTFNLKNNLIDEFLITKLPLEEVLVNYLCYLVQFSKLCQVFVLINIIMLIKKMPPGEFHHTHLEW
jgi:hypothetical protein